MADADTVRVEYVALSAIQRWPRNPKLHDKGRIDNSIERFGFIQPLVVDESSGQLVAGHGRLESLLGMQANGKDPPKRITVGADGEWLVPVIRGVGFATEQEAESFLLADNRLVELGGWDAEQLGKMLDDITANAGSIDMLGFEQHAGFSIPEGGAPEAPVVDEATVVARLKVTQCPHCGGEVPI